MCAASDLLPLQLGAPLARSHAMDRKPPTYIEINLDHEETTDAALDGNVWFDEKTSRIDFNRPTLTAEEKMVFGYLTMEQHGMFGELSLDEQQEIANTLKK